MSYVGQMLLQGTRLLHHDPYLGRLTARTLRLALEATSIAVAVGLPCAVVIGLGRARATRWGWVLANAGLGLPPVAVGVYGLLLLRGRQAPWGGPWVESLNGVVAAQAVLALPVVVAVGAAAVGDLPPGLLDQARAYGARGGRLGWFAVREARVGVGTGVLLALGSAVAEVGAVALIGGNSEGATATLASQMVNDARATNVPALVEHGIVLLGLTLVLGLGLTAVQGRVPRVRALRPAPRRVEASRA